LYFLKMFFNFTQQKGNASIMNVYWVCGESFGGVVQKKLQLLLANGRKTFTYQRWFEKRVAFRRPKILDPYKAQGGSF
jgi:hypothetical protein